MLQKLLKVMIGQHSPSQPSQQLVWMVEVVVFSNESDKDLIQLVLGIELHLDTAAVIKPEPHLELAAHQPNHNWRHHQIHSTFKLTCIVQCFFTF